MDDQESNETVQRVEITGDLDPSAVEALRLEIHRLAKRYGVEVKRFRIEKVADGGGDSEGEETAG